LIGGAAGVAATVGARQATVARDLPSFPWGNVVQVPHGGNTQVLTAASVERVVVISNIGMVPVFITNGISVAPDGIRIAAGATLQFTTSQAVTLSALSGVNSFNPAIERQTFDGTVAVAG
jgi:hypothetical protein